VTTARPAGKYLGEPRTVARSKQKPKHSIDSDELDFLLLKTNTSELRAAFDSIADGKIEPDQAAQTK
jgi:hypothetical protein